MKKVRILSSVEVAVLTPLGRHLRRESVVGKAYTVAGTPVCAFVLPIKVILLVRGEYGNSGNEGEAYRGKQSYLPP